MRGEAGLVGIVRGRCSRGSWGLRAQNVVQAIKKANDILSKSGVLDDFVRIDVMGRRNLHNQSINWCIIVEVSNLT